MITARRSDGETVELRPGQALCGAHFHSVTITRDADPEKDPFLTRSETQRMALQVWLGIVLTCRLVPEPPKLQRQEQPEGF